MTDLDQRIASVLRERAEGEIDTHRLLRASRAQGRRRQLRRRAVTGGALALVGVLGFMGVAGTELPGLPGRLPWTAATPTVAPAVPPRVDGVAGAAQRPDLVGTDPAVLHLGVDTTKASYLGWAVKGFGVETVRIEVGGGQPVTVDVARTVEVFDGLGIEGFPIDAVPTRRAFDGTVRQVRGTTGGLIMSWQPAAGVYARAAMLGGDRAALARAVDALRWDEARRCGTPLRLGTLPTDATVGGCSVDVSAFPGTINAELTLYRGRSATMYVRLQYAAQMVGVRADGNRTVGSRPAYLYPDGGKLELLGIPKVHLVADFGWPAQGFTEADAATALAGARVADDLTRPESWD
ncbi:hypothetical protein DLE60_20735 [Micromonospora globispora]|uniref:hypothetical protein n=1 Tax=Micromonospora globispora TaxID=1450148 RepID=UPI000D6ECF5C|nr:hypothetical protein [Micromonospora globispora]PWU58633.1 hypothetical protein DLE60_20735 [Micromonospora globispora]